MIKIGRSQLLVLAVVLHAAASAAAHAQTMRSQQSTSPATEFTPKQTERIVKLRPWPPPWKPDPSNRVSGSPDAVALGRSLFFDARLSGKGTHSCSSCHRPEMAWQDGKRVGEGLAPGTRNTPSLFDVRYRRWFGWDGAGDSLWAQSIRPILDPREMGASAEHVRAHIAGNATLATTYLGLFQRDAAATPAEDVLVDAAKVMAAYQETLVSLRAPFDAFRDRLAAGKGKVAADDAYPIAARRGLQVFIGTGQCIRCHAGPSFDHGGFERLHKDAPPATQATDPGRYAGVRRLHDNPYNLRSRFNDSGTRIPFWAGRGHDVGRGRANKGMFRVPGLRGTKDTAPYMHDGSVTTLAEAIAHPVPATQFWKTYRRKLTAAEIADLVAFLETLSPP